MAAAARITRPLGPNSAFMKAARHKGAAETARRLNNVAKRAEQIFDEIVQSELVNDRAADRRKTGRHLLGSANAQVEWDGVEFPVVLSLGSLAESAKVNSLNHGSKAHTITGNPWLVFPVASRGAPKGQGAGVRVARAAAYGRQRKGSPTVRTNSVNHPGTKAYYFIERALERAVEEAYQKSLRLRRV